MDWTLLVALVNPAFAGGGDYEERIDDAREALFAEDWDGAVSSLDAAEAAASEADVLLANADVARLPFYRGILAWHDGDQEAAMAHWRRAAAMSPDMRPESGVLEDPETRDIVHAIIEEVRNGTEVGTNVPEEAPGEVFVDGIKREPGDTIPLGNHLVQVRCEDGRVVSAWHEYGTPPKDYFLLCEAGSFEGKAPRKSKPAPSGEGREEPDDFGDLEGLEDEDSEDEDEDEPEEEEEEEEEVDPYADLDEPSRKKPKGGGGGGGKGGGQAGKNIAGISMLGLSAVGGGATIYTWTRAQQASDIYENKLDAEDAKPRQTRNYYDTTVIPNWTAFYVSAGATGLLLAGGVVFIALDVDGPGLAPLPGGGGLVTWNGRF